MNVAKWLLIGVLALPVAELVTFIVVAAHIGFGMALLLILAGSLLGGLVLKHAGGNHIERMRLAMADGGFTTVKADSDGFLILFAGILLLVPGFITDVLGLTLLVGPLRRGIASYLGVQTAPPPRDGVLDLEPEQWRRMPDPALPPRRDDDERANR